MEPGIAGALEIARDPEASDGPGGAESGLAGAETTASGIAGRRGLGNAVRAAAGWDLSRSRPAPKSGVRVW